MYPVSYEADYKREPNRLNTFFRVCSRSLADRRHVYIIAAPLHLPRRLVRALFTGRYPEGLYNFNSGLLRYFVRVNSFVFLLTDQYPPFGISPDPTYPVRLEIAPRAGEAEPSEGPLPAASWRSRSSSSPTR